MPDPRPPLVLASMDVPGVITASWGMLLHDGYTHLTHSVWPVLFAGSMLFGAALGFTLPGEALRDAIDPQSRAVP